MCVELGNSTAAGISRAIAGKTLLKSEVLIEGAEPIAAKERHYLDKPFELRANSPSGFRGSL